MCYNSQAWKRFLQHVACCDPHDWCDRDFKKPTVPTKWQNQRKRACQTFLKELFARHPCMRSTEASRNPRCQQQINTAQTRRSENKWLDHTRGSTGKKTSFNADRKKQQIPINTASLSQQASAQSTEADVHKEPETLLENMSSTRHWAMASGGFLRVRLRLHTSERVHLCVWSAPNNYYLNTWTTGQSFTNYR